MPTLKDTAMTETLSELHATYAPLGPDIREPGYCRLSSRRGLLRNAEKYFVESNGCPVCKQPAYALKSDAQLFTESYNAAKAHENALLVQRPQPREEPRPGPGVGQPPTIPPLA